MNARPPGTGSEHPPTEADNRSSATARELLWLNRRRDLLRRAIAEMEYNVATPGIRLELVSNIPELLAWAKGELSLIENRISVIDQGGRRDSD